MFSEDEATQHQPACKSDPSRKAWVRAAESFLATERLRHGFVTVEQQKKSAIEHANQHYSEYMIHGLRSGKVSGP